MSFQEYSRSLASRLHMGETNKKVIAGIITLLVVAAIALCLNLAGIEGDKSADALVVKSDTVDETSVNLGEEDAEPRAILCVHMGGCVAIPGVVSLEEGSRVADALEAAGGFTADAAVDALNLARLVEDGEQIIVPSVEQAQAAAATSVQSDGLQASAEQAGTGKININKASAAELQTLSGIGASKAQKIIDYRESKGSFKSVDDLTSVSGIGDKTLEAIRDQICV